MKFSLIHQFDQLETAPQTSIDGCMPNGIISAIYQCKTILRLNPTLIFDATSRTVEGLTDQLLRKMTALI
jgi:hypothetical protein